MTPHAPTLTESAAAPGTVARPASRGLAVIVPANNEESMIGRCLAALVESAVPRDLPVDVVVAANGCSDRTVEQARSFRARFEARSWRFTVLDLPEAGKISALNAGDAAARGALRAYLDADVKVSKPLLGQIVSALNRDTPAFASGHVRIPRPASTVSRAYRRFYLTVPFMTHGVPGCGFFAVNAPGRARWGAFPDVIADDIFARLNFAPHERIGVPAGYEWPLVEGWSNLVRVRRRQNAGVAEIARRFPDLLRNEDKPAFAPFDILQRAAADPVAFSAYAAVAAIVRVTPGRARGWSRGR